MVRVKNVRFLKEKRRKEIQKVGKKMYSKKEILKKTYKKHNIDTKRKKKTRSKKQKKIGDNIESIVYAILVITY